MTGEEDKRGIPEYVQGAIAELHRTNLIEHIRLECNELGILVVARVSVQLTVASRQKRVMQHLVLWSVILDYRGVGNPLIVGCNRVAGELKTFAAETRHTT